jgi:hypothetical protein
MYPYIAPAAGVLTGQYAYESAALPVARYIRWYVSPSGVGAWRLTFRLWLSLNYSGNARRAMQTAQARARAAAAARARAVAAPQPVAQAAKIGAPQRAGAARPPGRAHTQASVATSQTPAMLWRPPS